jgi:hypothetical protein
MALTAAQLEQQKQAAEELLFSGPPIRILDYSPIHTAAAALN